MKPQCPHCQQPLDFSDSQLAKIKKALAVLQPGKVLKLGCPSCKQSIELEADASGRVLEEILYAPGGKTAPKKPVAPVRTPHHAPQPPEMGWLAKEEYVKRDTWVDDVPTAMLLIPEGAGAALVGKAFQDMGYQIVLPKSSAEAIEKQRFVNFAAVVYHVSFENGGIDSSSFHRHMRKMAMGKRRYTLYALIGPGFKTFYDLEALANSANLVINDADLRHLPVILKKAIHDYEALFSPLINMMQEHGKK